MWQWTGQVPQVVERSSNCHLCPRISVIEGIIEIPRANNRAKGARESSKKDHSLVEWIPFRKHTHTLGGWCENGWMDGAAWSRWMVMG